MPRAFRHVPRDREQATAKLIEALGLYQSEGPPTKKIKHFRNLVECIQKGSQDTWSPGPLAYRTQTALIMAMQSLREGKTARFDAEKDCIVS